MSKESDNWAAEMLYINKRVKIQRRLDVRAKYAKRECNFYMENAEDLSPDRLNKPAKKYKGKTESKWKAETKKESSKTKYKEMNNQICKIGCVEDK